MPLNARSFQSDVPKDGCLKSVPGYVEQVFGENGQLIKQQFIADDSSEYTDQDGLPIEMNDNCINWYHPFGMLQPNHSISSIMGGTSVFPVTIQLQDGTTKVCETVKQLPNRIAFKVIKVTDNNPR